MSAFLLQARGRRSKLVQIYLSCGLGLSAPAQATSDDGQDTVAEIGATSQARPTEMPLAPLTIPEKPRLPKARRSELQAIDDFLQRLSSPSPEEREKAWSQIPDVPPQWLPGLAQTIDRLAERVDRKELKKLLSRARKQKRRQMREAGEGDQPTPDYLGVLLDLEDTQSNATRDLIQILGLSRLLVELDSTAAARELIRIYARFGEFLRIDTERQLNAMGDRSVAALIEARRHPAQKIAAWATKFLRERELLDPHAAIQIKDHQALHDILVALGRSRDLDSAPLLLSFASSQHALIRRGAREGLALLGRSASWKLKDAYLNITGRRAPRDWTWQRIARELFTEYDRLRLEKQWQLYEAGRTAVQENDWLKVSLIYGEILTTNPSFQKAHEFADPLYQAALFIRDQNPELARINLRRIERITTDPSLQARAQSLRFLLATRAAEKRGHPDLSRVREARQLDPKNPLLPANQIKSPATQTPSVFSSALSRYSLAIGSLLIALLGSVWIFYSSRRPVDD